MSIEIGDTVALPEFTPYPRFGRIVAIGDEGVQVDHIQCGDPRCTAEHVHGAEIWPAAAIESAGAYQPRAPWEWGRKASPNTPID